MNRVAFILMAITLTVGGSVVLSELPLLAAAEDEGNGLVAARSEAPAIDYVAQSARLIHDGHPDRVPRTLSEIGPKDPGVDTKRFYTLRGIAYLQLKEFKNARDDFNDAIISGQEDPSVRLYLAQTYFGLKNYKGTLMALRQAGAAANKSANATLMGAEAHWKLGQKPEAVALLQAGAKRFPRRPEFERSLIFYLIDLGLYLEAVDVSGEYWARPGVMEDDYVAVGEALRAANEFKKAQLILEGAHLKFPASEKVMLQLAHSYLDDERTVSGAMLFEDAARLEPKYTLEAAELYKKAGMAYRAMTLNARVADQKAKAKQRLSLLLEAENFEAVTAMVPKLSRLGLLADESIRYALAYAFFKTQRFDKAELQLKKITQPELFESALQLRKAMANCRDAGWECTL